MSDSFAYLWFGLTALSTAYIGYDLFTRTPEMKVMKLGWISSRSTPARSPWLRAMEPAKVQFWFSMSVSALVGGVVAIPVNLWLVSKGLKHGMGTDRALGRGGSGGQASPTPAHEMTRMSSSPVHGIVRTPTDWARNRSST